MKTVNTDTIKINGIEIGKTELPDVLEQLVAGHNTPDFIVNDPIQIPRRFSRLQDIEVSAFLVSVITWGRRRQILNNADKMLSEMDNRPYDYITRGRFRTGNTSLHRTFMWDDFAQICHSMQSYYRRFPSLESLFADSAGGLDMSRYKDVFHNPHISHWENGSASKRIHMFLRWMVRNDGIVDIGCWKKINPAALYIPLDTHVARTARELGLLLRKSNDRKAVEELTSVLKTLCNDDPIKYDFALFGSAVSTNTQTNGTY